MPCASVLAWRLKGLWQRRAASALLSAAGSWVLVRLTAHESDSAPQCLGQELVHLSGCFGLHQLPQRCTVQSRSIEGLAGGRLSWELGTTRAYKETKNVLGKIMLLKQSKSSLKSDSLFSTLSPAASLLHACKLIYLRCEDLEELLPHARQTSVTWQQPSAGLAYSACETACARQDSGQPFVVDPPPP